jgi:Do/DeqQ family serine protease
MLALAISAAPARAADPFLRRTPTVAAVQKVGPSVVNITTEQVVAQASPFRHYSNDPTFDQFFRDFFEPRVAPRTLQNLGSGVIFDAAGHVLTNEHVIARATRIRVSLSDGREFDASVVGADPTNDIAVLQVETQDELPWVPPGDSSDLLVGEPVIAIGNPFGLSNTVTTGVISALNRSIRGQDHVFHGFLQTDASINPGNSGGPLLNAEGALIGINSAIYSSAQGIGFAIPINVARRVVAELIEHGEVPPVTLGLDFQDLEPALREVMQLPKTVVGALVNRVHPGGAAERAGLRRGDIVARLDDRPVQSAAHLFELLEAVTPQQQVRLEVWRNDKSLDLTVVAERIPEGYVKELANRSLGVELEPLKNGGFRVTDVRSASPAERIGVRPGDWILGISGLALTDEDALRRALLGLRGRDRALVVVQRGAGRYHLTIPLR